jgi:peptidoglycan/LPS O-acetylase OafA/YrhL
MAVTAYPVIVTSFKPGILRYGFYFAIGIAIFEERARIARLFDRCSAPMTALIVVAGLAFFGATTAFALFYETPGPFLSATGGAILVSCAVFVPRVRRFLSLPALVHHGKVSYSFYLLHLTVLTVCTRMIAGPASLEEALVLLGISFLITTGCSEIAYRVAERPSILLGNALCRRIAAWTGGVPQMSGLAR